MKTGFANQPARKATARREGTARQTNRHELTKRGIPRSNLTSRKLIFAFGNSIVTISSRLVSTSSSDWETFGVRARPRAAFGRWRRFESGGAPPDLPRMMKTRGSE